MNSTVNAAVADLLRQADADIEFRLEAQEEALREIKCQNPISQWVGHGVEYITSVLDLDDFSFAKRFPSIAHVGQERRQKMKAEIISHLGHCKHCSLAHSYQLELDARIMSVWRENKDRLFQLLDEDGIDLSEGEHLATELVHVIEHQPVIHCEPEIIINPLVEPI